MGLEKLIENGKPDESAEAKGYNNQLQSFDSLLMLVMMDEVLECTNTLSEYLQHPQLIYTRAISLCEASVKTLFAIRNEDSFEKIWKEAFVLAEKVFVPVPSPQDVPNSSKRRKISSKRLSGSIVLSTTGNNASEVTTIKQKLRSTFFMVIDRFVSEINHRLVDNTGMLKGLSAADPKNELFMDMDEVLKFCSLFNRFNFNNESLKCQIRVAKNLLKAEGIDRVLNCYEYIKSIKDGFSDLLLYYNLVLCFPVSSASSERSFSSIRRIKSNLRTTMLEKRVSNLSLLSINRDLSTRLKENPMLVVDEFGKNPDRKISFSL